MRYRLTLLHNDVLPSTVGSLYKHGDGAQRSGAYNEIVPIWKLHEFGSNTLYSSTTHRPKYEPHAGLHTGLHAGPLKGQGGDPRGRPSKRVRAGGAKLAEFSLDQRLSVSLQARLAQKESRDCAYTVQSSRSTLINMVILCVQADSVLL